jgi:hypothetical protein
MIVAHRGQLAALAYELLDHEVLDREAIQRIISGVPRLERARGVGLRVVAAAKSHDAPASPVAIDAPPGTAASAVPAHTLVAPPPGEGDGSETGRR